MQPLTGVRVIDVTHVLAGPYCTMILGDMGAEVIKVEPYPDGDMIRSMPPYYHGISYGFTMINRNKFGMRLNLHADAGREILYKLVETADVFVENFRPGVAAKMGIDYDTLKKYNPNLIYCSISGYGQNGPSAQKGGLDIIAQGASGIMSMTGEKGGRPAKVGVPIHDIGAGLTALYHILLSYIHKLKTGEGQYIDVSLVDSCLAWTVWEAAAYFGAGEVPEPTGSRHRRIAPYQGFRTQNGYILLGAPTPRMWERLCSQVLGKPEMASDPRFATEESRLQNVDELEKCIEEVLVQKPKEYWLEKLEEAGIPSGPIYTYDEVLRHEQTKHREMVLEYEYPGIGPMKMLGFPAKMSKTPGRFRMPAPQLGQHTEEILKSLQFTDEQISELKAKSII